MDTEPLRHRLDSFPYSHRLRDVMTPSVFLVSPGLSLSAAAREMDRQRSSSLLIQGDGDGVASGIITEHDIMRAVARDGAAALDQPVSAYMSTPVERLPPDAMVYQALGRMDRLGVRHLAVADDDARAIGVITVDGLMSQRVTKALALGDEIAVAPDAESMARVILALPSLVSDLLAERVPALTIAAVISAVMREATARAAELAEAELGEAGMGGPPAPYCVLVLGSAGRSESLLAPDQDNALIHAGQPGDDPWFAALAERMTRILDGAGVPYCEGDVMASRPLWRHDCDGWQAQLERWIRSPKPDHLLNVDIFYDFKPVFGERRLARDLRQRALDLAAGSIVFLKVLSVELELFRPPLGLLGGFQTLEGRLDLKLGGLFPIVTGARTMALRHRVEATSTLDRLTLVHEAGYLSAGDFAGMVQALHLLYDLILCQQIADIEAGEAPRNRVQVGHLETDIRRRLKRALKMAGTVPEMVKSALAG